MTNLVICLTILRFAIFGQRDPRTSLQNQGGGTSKQLSELNSPFRAISITPNTCLLERKIIEAKKLWAGAEGQGERLGANRNKLFGQLVDGCEMDGRDLVSAWC